MAVTADYQVQFPENDDIYSILAAEGIEFLLSHSGEVPLEYIHGKTICLFFSANWCRPCKDFTPELVKLYESLQKRGEELEIIFVSFDHDMTLFYEHFWSMPWLAVPFSLSLRNKLTDKYRVARIPSLVPLYPDEISVADDVIGLIEDYGPEAFPFTKKRKEELKAIDDSKRVGGQLEKLLTHETRSYVVSRNGSKVLVSDLVGKTIGLYFGAHWCPPFRSFTSQLIDVYNELTTSTKGSFEVILVSTDRDSREFNINMTDMPWLAIPYEDRTRQDLCRIFNIKLIPALVIIGPEEKTVCTNAREMVSLYGSRSYPFTESRIVELEACLKKEGDSFPRKVKDKKHEHELKLDMAKGYVCDFCKKQGKGADDELAAWVESVARTEWNADVFDKEMRAGKEQEGQMLKLLKIGLRCCDWDVERRMELHEAVDRIEEVDHREAGGSQESFRSSYVTASDVEMAVTADYQVQFPENDDIYSILAAEGIEFLLSHSGEVPLEYIHGKTICLFFSANWCRPCKDFTPELVKLYEILQKRGEEIEIIFVSFDHDMTLFYEHFWSMPWLAVPFSLSLRNKLTDKYRVARIPSLVPLYPGEISVADDVIGLIEDYGPEAFPFTKKRKEELKAIDESKRVGGQLEKLLTHESRSYVVSRNGSKVLVSDLVGKTIGLYFGAHWCPPFRSFTSQLIDVYNELTTSTKGSFEVILVSTDRDSREFNINMTNMPWLAIPFEDRTRQDLCRIFNIKLIPALVIIGPEEKTVCTNAREMVSLYGSRSYPFTESRIVELEACLKKEGDSFPRKVKDKKHEHELKLDMAKGYVCDFCKKQGKFWAFSCDACDYDLHPTCVEEQEASLV
ncbi:hypothetical protein F2Q68_00029125 [Brassica cretica]|uniref:protein-disulfide reductase n=1 Tax=Brassica cretica TaxID=69181 RepID=A0A8S9GAU3_BRACR|nr:hypothetical protein F2Q68_00029125 [Brassica cretica]